ncbi:glycerophosphodiester phosphodiesterase family protein [Sphingorhabdus sp. Alg239-R122]|uniref:glycerophosphodiester phosphodiesterase family protein n=1 Tax=Sphingorhabdus sp. Alg239-R122 TaxID=2305989 RepID=UPI0013D9759C|nr:glycerophosphodiester phosphodiesterase family protein [Sphingorhabdus sp. Alg239-R122]
MKWVKIIGLVLGLALLVLSFMNASWMASTPRGKATVIADRNVYQSFSREGLGPDDCTATRIDTPTHKYLENTVASATKADQADADMLGFHVALTKDGEVVLFHDWTLDCRTDGSGPIRDKTLAELKELDIGYGYSADGGKTFPFRGKHVGAMPTIEEIAYPFRHRKMLFRLKSKDPKEADALIAALKKAGITDMKRMAFMAPAPVAARLRELTPESWVIDPVAAKRCTKDYALQGWFTMTPESCRGETLIVPLNYQWLVAGWPKRTIERMEAVDAKILLTGPYIDGNAMQGLTTREQIRDVPFDFNGYVMVDNIQDIGPAMP